MLAMVTLQFSSLFLWDCSIVYSYILPFLWSKQVNYFLLQLVYEQSGWGVGREGRQVLDFSGLAVPLHGPQSSDKGFLFCWLHKKRVREKSGLSRGVLRQPVKQTHREIGIRVMVSFPALPCQWLGWGRGVCAKPTQRARTCTAGPRLLLFLPNFNRFSGPNGLYGWTFTGPHNPKTCTQMQTSFLKRRMTNHGSVKGSQQQINGGLIGFLGLRRERQF